jgi:hypothetical protein
MPAAIRLLQAPAIAPGFVERRRLATIFVVLASAAALRLENLVGWVEARAIFDNPWELNVISALNAIAANVPEILLFIALALLALESGVTAEVHEGPDADALPPEQAAG